MTEGTNLRCLCKVMGTVQVRRRVISLLRLNQYSKVYRIKKEGISYMKLLRPTVENFTPKPEPEKDTEAPFNAKQLKKGIATAKIHLESKFPEKVNCSRVDNSAERDSKGSWQHATFTKIPYYSSKSKQFCFNAY